MRKIRKPKSGLKIWAIAFAVWIIVFLIVFNSFGLDAVFSELSKMKVTWLFAAIIAFIAAEFLAVINWHMLLDYLKIKVKLSIAWQVMFAGNFVDNMLPNIAPGGEIAMAYLLHKKENANLPKTLASIVMQMISWFVGLIVFSAIVLVSLLILGTVTIELAVILISFLMIFSLFLVIIIYLTLKPEACIRIVSGITTRIFSLIARVMHTQSHERKTKRLVAEIVTSFHSRINSYANNKIVISASCITMFVHHLLYALSFYFILLAFGVAMPIELAFAIFITINLISLVSMVPGQIGIYEVLAATLLSFSTTPVSAVLITTVARLIHYWSIVFIGGFFAVKLGLETITPEVTKK